MGCNAIQSPGSISCRAPVASRTTAGHRDTWSAMAPSAEPTTSKLGRHDQLSKRLPLLLTAVAVAIVAVPGIRWWRDYRRTQLATDLLAAINRADVAGVNSLL